MNSGIYKLTFNSGHYYIGKSENIPKRWETHRRNFLQGKHTKRMQWAYNHWGMPKFEVLYQVHPDHLDIYEEYSILSYWDDDWILNGTKPKPISEDTEDELILASKMDINGTKLLLMSTLEHLYWIRALDQNYKILEEELRLVKDSEELPQLLDIYIDENTKLELKVRELERICQEHNNKLKKLKYLSWWNRLFKWYKYIGRI